MKTYNQLKEMFLTSNQALIRDDIGIYYEIDFEYKTIRLEYYKQGERVEHQSLKF